MAFPNVAYLYVALIRHEIAHNSWVEIKEKLRCEWETPMLTRKNASKVAHFYGKMPAISRMLHFYLKGDKTIYSMTEIERGRERESES